VPGEFHLAQVNIARMKGPLDSAVMAGFVARIAEINALADAHPGFVWRLPSGVAGDAYLRPYDDDRVLFNLSSWRTVDDLRRYVYRSVHVELLRRRHEWFDKLDSPQVALWWIPAGQPPTVDEAKARLAHLQENGATSIAFDFRRLFPPPL
jgi:hypothetical protein